MAKSATTGSRNLGPQATPPSQESHLAKEEYPGNDEQQEEHRNGSISTHEDYDADQAQHAMGLNTKMLFPGLTSMPSSPRPIAVWNPCPL